MNGYPTNPSARFAWVLFDALLYGGLLGFAISDAAASRWAACGVELAISALLLLKIGVYWPHGEREEKGKPVV